jgi:hypothetical protein
MHRVFKAADARVKEHRHGKFATGHRPRDHNSGELKSMNDVGIHKLASSITATARNRKSPKEMEVSYRWRGRAREHREAFHKIKCSHRTGQRLAG